MIRRMGAFVRVLLAVIACAGAAHAARVQTAAEALAQDATALVALAGITEGEAAARLAAQEATVPLTDALAVQHAGRLAGIAVDHRPDFRITVLLAGDAPPPADFTVEAAGLTVPIVFRTGAAATRAQLAAAIRDHQAELRAVLARPPAMGVDLRTGELVVLVSDTDLLLEDEASLAATFARIAGVPVRVRAYTRTADAMLEGGARVVGVDPADGRAYACTTGFTVTDGDRQGVVTAAHCPDALSLLDPVAGRVPLTMVEAWGAGHQDVQVHVSATGDGVGPLFLADTAKTLARPVEAARARLSTRAGDLVCHRGERTGYSCATVDLVDFAPAGALCAGPCTPTWVSVNGPNCRGGDSGAPVFVGTAALGIVKGGSYRGDGSCAFYFYMSVDYLPSGWSLLRAEPAPPSAPPAAALR